MLLLCQFPPHWQRRQLPHGSSLLCRAEIVFPRLSLDGHTILEAHRQHGHVQAGTLAVILVWAAAGVLSWLCAGEVAQLSWGQGTRLCVRGRLRNLLMRR